MKSKTLSLSSINNIIASRHVAAIAPNNIVMTRLDHIAVTSDLVVISIIDRISISDQIVVFSIHVILFPRNRVCGVGYDVPLVVGAALGEERRLGVFEGFGDSA